MSTPEVSRAVPRQRWILSEIDTREAAALAREAQLPLLVAELLLARGIRDASSAELFLNPDFDHLIDPYLMLGMDRAVLRIQQAAAAREPVLIYDLWRLRRRWNHRRRAAQDRHRDARRSRPLPRPASSALRLRHAA